VIGAMAILTSVALLVMELVGHSNKSSVNDERSGVAIQLASDNLEDLIRRYPTDPLLAAGEHRIFFDRAGRQVPSAPAAFYTASWTIVPNTPIATTLQIKQSVTWQTGGTSRRVELSTYRSAP
jgi:hypothetical protein